MYFYELLSLMKLLDLYERGVDKAMDVKWEMKEQESGALLATAAFNYDPRTATIVLEIDDRTPDGSGTRTHTVNYDQNLDLITFTTDEMAVFFDQFTETIQLMHRAA